MFKPHFRSLKDLDETEGTVSLVEGMSQHPLNKADQIVVSRHKHKRGTDIVLVPQPSDDINDPLNWPAWKRALAFSTICAFTFVASWTLGGLGAAIVELSVSLNANINDVVHGTVSWVSLTIGLAVCLPSVLN
jgi:hypothetical protein